MCVDSTLSYAYVYIHIHVYTYACVYIYIYIHSYEFEYPILCKLPSQFKADKSSNLLGVILHEGIAELLLQRAREPTKILRSFTSPSN